MSSTRSALTLVMPTFGLQVRWGDLTLRLPDDVELLALAGLAADGVHGPGAPFSWPWTRGTRDEIRRNVLAHQWKNRARTAVDDWVLSLAVFRNDQVVGEQQISAKGFDVARAGRTGSWLGLRHHGQGIGTRIRLMVLHLAFEGFGAAEMHSEADEDNVASNAVSRRLGYVPNGSQSTTRDGRSVIENAFRMTSDAWDARPDDIRPEIVLDGVAPVRELFGIEERGQVRFRGGTATPLDS